MTSAKPSLHPSTSWSLNRKILKVSFGLKASVPAFFLEMYGIVKMDRFNDTLRPLQLQSSEVLVNDTLGALQVPAGLIHFPAQGSIIPFKKLIWIL